MIFPKATEHEFSQGSCSPAQGTTMHESNGTLRLIVSYLQFPLIFLQVDSGQHLANISRLRLREYQYADAAVYRGTAAATVSVGGGSTSKHLGVLAQEIQEVIPDAVKETV